MATPTKLELQQKIAKLEKGLSNKALSSERKSKLRVQIKGLKDDLAKMSKAKTPSERIAQAKALALKIRKTQGGVPTKKSDVEKDATRSALKKVKRISQGLRANQYGDKSDNKGSTYYEYRENRKDRKPERYPKLADGGMMAKGGRISKGSKYMGTFRTTDGNSGYSIYEIVDTDYFSNKYGGSPHTIRHKVIESSNPQLIGKFDEDSKETIKSLLKNGIWTKLEHYADGGMMAKGGMIKAIRNSDADYYVNEYGEIDDNGKKKMYAIEIQNENGDAIEYLSADSENDANMMIKKINIEQSYANGGMMAKGGQVSGFFKFVPYKKEGGFFVTTKFENEPPNSVVVKGLEGKLKGNDIHSAEEIAHAIMQEHPYIAKLDIVKQGANVLKNKKVATFIRDEDEDDRYKIEFYADGGLLGYASGGSATSSVGGTTFSNGDLSDMFAKGGTISNQYKGKSAKDVWGMWTFEQKTHFLKDHFLTNMENYLTKKEYKEAEEQIREAKYLSWDELPSIIQSEVDKHLFMGQYAHGGVTYGRFSGAMSRYAHAISSYIDRTPKGITFAEMKHYLEREFPSKDFSKETIYAISRTLYKTNDYVIDDNKDWKESIIKNKRPMAYAHGGVVDNMFQFIESISKKEGGKQFTIQEYHNYRDDMYNMGVEGGFFDDTDENYSTFDYMLGKKLNVKWEYAHGGEIHRAEGGDIYAHGGMTQHGLQIGDMIIGHDDNSIVVKDRQGKTYMVNLNSGKRWEMNEWEQLSTREQTKLKKG